MGPKKPPLPPWLEKAAIIRKRLKQRGFSPNDRIQICEVCQEYGEEGWSLRGGEGRMGGRDIAYCMSCGRSRSWRGAMGGVRAVEDPFDLVGFLGIKPDSID